MEINKETNIDSKNISSNLDDRKIWRSFYISKGSILERNIFSEVTVFFLLKGTLMIRINEEKEWKVNSNEMFIFSDTSSCHIRALESAHLMTCSFQIDSLSSEQLIINKIDSFLDKNYQNDFSKLPINGLIARYLLLLNDCIKDNFDSCYFFDLKRYELFLLLFNYYSRQDLAQFLSILLGENIQFKKFVMNHYRDVKKVHELAVLANYSTSGFIKKFKKCFNESPYKWMQRQKAGQILIEINQGKKSLKEIAGEYNFSSYQHFAAFCKIQFGFPPTEIREKIY